MCFHIKVLFNLQCILHSVCRFIIAFFSRFFSRWRTVVKLSILRRQEVCVSQLFTCYSQHDTSDYHKHIDLCFLVEIIYQLGKRCLCLKGLDKIKVYLIKHVITCSIQQKVSGWPLWMTAASTCLWTVITACLCLRRPVLRRPARCTVPAALRGKEQGDGSRVAVSVTPPVPYAQIPTACGEL